MKKPVLIQLVAVLGLLLSLLPLRADTLNNTFDTPFNYVANGIIGDTNWDGVFLRSGDIPGGSSTGGDQTAANTTTFAGFLALQNIGGDWSGADDDGFFIYKVVQGDFDVSVENEPYTLSGGTSFDNRAYNFTGLQLRAYHTNHSGAPYSTTLANNAENSLRLWRFNEFGIDGQVRISTNGANIELNFPGADTEIATPRSYRIVRTDETNFTFYVKTNATDAWAQITNGLPAGGVLTRADWAGVKLQVGIAQAAFNTATRDAVFDNFVLTGPNVTFPAMPPAAANLVATATNTLGALTFSWNRTGGDGNLVVVSRRPIQHNPVQGTVYNANSVYGDATTLLGGAGEFVVYSGPATSVTVTNLGANNLTYYVAVFSYSNATQPVYNTAAPATASFAGPGIITGASIFAPAKSIPVGGAMALRLMATFSTGEASDQTALTSWATSDGTVAPVNASGTVSGLLAGSATITATFGTYNPTVGISVHDPIFTENFATTHDFITTGLQGTPWDGLFLNYGDVPGANKGNDNSAGQTFRFLAETNVLSVQAAGGSWRVAGNDGPYLFKIVTGDFQASVHVTCGVINNNYAGIMARLFNNTGTSSQGGGGGAGGTETHFNWGNPQQGAPSARLTVDSGGTTVVGGLNNTDRWLLMQRVNSTNFYVYEKALATDLWNAVPAATMVVAEAANNAPMEVGLFQEMRSAATDVAQFDTFMLDGPGIVSTNATPPPPAASEMTATLNADLSITYTWVAADTAGNPVTSILVMRAGGPVTAQPTYGLAPGWPSGVFGTGLSLGDGNYVVYRSTATTTNNTATITGLTPGAVYYAAVYTFAGTYPDRVFNNILPATGATATTQDGALQTVTVLPVPTIPLGGIQIPQVLGDFAGSVVNVSAFATWTIADTNIVQMAPGSGVLSGMALGSTTAQVVYASVTNSVGLTVRQPTFTDNFTTSHDYLAAGVAGTSWDGAYGQGLGVNAVPNSPYVGDPTLGTAVADANISSNAVLTVTGTGDGWENDTVGGFFLFKYVPGDFQAAVHINTLEVAGYNQPGLLARAYGGGVYGTNIGSPYVIGPLRTNNANVVIDTYGESWVSLTRFDEFDIGTYARLTLDSDTQQSTQTDQNDGNMWLLIVRTGGTDFSFYKRATATEPWKPIPNKTTYSQPEFAGAPMQVGLMAGDWWWTAGENRTVRFEKFMLDTTTGSSLKINLTATDAILSWPAIPNAKVQSTDNLSAPNWQLEGGTPVLGVEGFSLTVPIGTITQKFYRLVQ